MERMLPRRLACVRVTPLGSPVEPEVYWSSAMSLDLRTRAPERCAGSGRRCFVRSVEKFFRVHHGIKRTNARTQQFGDDFSAAKREKHAHAGVVQNRCLAVGVFLDAVGAKWGIYGNRNSSRQ